MSYRDERRRAQQRSARTTEAGDSALRSRIAAEAARMISDSGIRDFGLAKRKAATHLGARDDTSMPSNTEVEEALRLHQRLFEADGQPQQLRALRNVALEAMQFFLAFEPRLVGAVLDGTADLHSAVCLHLFSDDMDAPLRLLIERGIAFKQSERTLRTGNKQDARLPVLTLEVEGTKIDLTVFALVDLRQAPLDRVDGRPMRRATRGALQQLLLLD